MEQSDRKLKRGICNNTNYFISPRQLPRVNRHTSVSSSQVLASEPWNLITSLMTAEINSSLIVEEREKRNLRIVENGEGCCHVFARVTLNSTQKLTASTHESIPRRKYSTVTHCCLTKLQHFDITITTFTSIVNDSHYVL